MTAFNHVHITGKLQFKNDITAVPFHAQSFPATNENSDWTDIEATWPSGHNKLCLSLTFKCYEAHFTVV